MIMSKKTDKPINIAIIKYILASGDIKCLMFQDTDILKLKKRCSIHLMTKNILSISLFPNLTTNKLKLNLKKKGVIYE